MSWTLWKPFTSETFEGWHNLRTSGRLERCITTVFFSPICVAGVDVPTAAAAADDDDDDDDDDAGGADVVRGSQQGRACLVVR